MSKKVEEKKEKLGFSKQKNSKIEGLYIFSEKIWQISVLGVHYKTRNYSNEPWSGKDMKSASLKMNRKILQTNP